MKVSRKAVGIVLVLLGVFLISPAFSLNVKKMQIGGAAPEVYWHYPFNEQATPSQLIADTNSVPWIQVYTPDETNYTEGWTEINNYLGSQPWPINGTLLISGSGFSVTSKLCLAGGTKMQVGYLYDFGLRSDWVTSIPWHTGDPVPAGSTVVAAWNDPSKLFLCTPGPLYQQLQQGIVCTFTWTINVPNFTPLTALGYGKKYYDLQGSWMLNGAPVAPVAVNVTDATLSFSFTPTVGAVNISSAYVQVKMRGALTPSTVTLVKNAAGNYTGSFSLGGQGVYDVGCFFTDIYGTVYASSGTVVIYQGNVASLTSVQSLSGFASIGLGIALIMLDKKRKA